MEGVVGSCLFELLGRGIHGLSGGSKGTCSQRLDVLSMPDFSAGVDYLLSGFKEFLGELSELENFSFDKRVS